jgi:hypothetical protein
MLGLKILIYNCYCTFVMLNTFYLGMSNMIFGTGPILLHHIYIWVCVLIYEVS